MGFKVIKGKYVLGSNYVSFLYKFEWIVEENYCVIGGYDN
jgi:hypothetical protein